MNRPLLRAEAIIVNEENNKVLVQCDDKETFYRFPGGSIEFGESACEAIVRELREEYNLQVQVAALAIVNEHIFEIEGKSHHHCTLFHWCKPITSVHEVLFHQEHENIILIWKSVQELKDKAIYPEEVISLFEQQGHASHSLVRKIYS